MDGFRFDSLARSLATASSRRRALGGLLAGALGLVGWPGGEDAAAHDLKAKCKKKSGEAKKKCLKKAKKHNATHTTQVLPPPNPCPGQPPGAPCPPCDRTGTSCFPGNSTSDVCCGGICLGNSDTAPGSCVPGEAGRPCYTNNDCNHFSGLTCINFRCQKALGVACDQEAHCASGECGCVGSTCTCRKSSCGAITAPCNPADPGGRDADCCEGSCTGCSVATAQCVCM
jgi:hypothetical protein